MKQLTRFLKEFRKVVTHVLVEKFISGKYKGRSLKELALEDKGYLEWLLDIKKEEGDKDWVYTLEYFLENK